MPTILQGSILPIPPDASLADNVTCAQEEILWLLALPAGLLTELGTDPLSEREAEDVASEMERRFAEMVWGPGGPAFSTPAFEERFGEFW